MSKPHCVLFEFSCGSKTINCAFVVLGAEMALRAVLIYDVEEADCHCDAGYSGAETPVVFHSICLVVGEGHEVHVALLKVSQSPRGKDDVCFYSNRAPNSTHAITVLPLVSMRVRSCPHGHIIPDKPRESARTLCMSETQHLRTRRISKEQQGNP